MSKLETIASIFTVIMGSLMTITFLRDLGLLKIDILQNLEILIKPTLSTVQVTFFFLTVFIIFRYFRRRAIDGHAPMVVSLSAPRHSTLAEILEEDRQEKIGKVLVYLRQNLGNGFIDIDAEIINYISRERTTIDQIATFLNEDEKIIIDRIDFMKKKGVIK